MLMHRYNFDPDKHVHKESCSDISIVETGGYLTTQQLVEGMVQSGQRLADFRNMMFDADVNLSEDELLDSPVLSEGDDIVDVTRRADEARRSMADTAAKASQTAQEGRPEPVPEPVVGEPAPAPGA